MKELIVAIVSVTITLFAVYVEHNLNNNTVNRIRFEDIKRETLLEIAQKSELRTQRMLMVVWAGSTKNKFSKRWDAYIESAVLQWDSSYYRMMVGLGRVTNDTYIQEAVYNLNSMYKQSHTLLEKDIFALREKNILPKKEALKEIEKKLQPLRDKTAELSNTIWKELEKNNLRSLL